MSDTQIHLSGDGDPFTGLPPNTPLPLDDREVMRSIEQSHFDNYRAEISKVIFNHWVDIQESDAEVEETAKRAVFAADALMSALNWKRP